MESKPIEKIKEFVKIDDVLIKYGIKKTWNGFIRCPFHDEKTASLKINLDTQKFKCFGCGATGDVIDLVQQLENCDKKTAIKKIIAMCGLDNGELTYTPTYYLPPQPKTEISEEQIKKTKQYIRSTIRNIKKTDYFQKRGLTEETIKRFKLGYDCDYKSVVIPYNRALTYYQTRTVEGKKFFKPRAANAGSEPIFNEIALSGKPPIFVVESPICAMSITQCGGNSIAICGCGCWNKIIKYRVDNGKIAHLILCLDNDKAGTEATVRLANALKSYECTFTIVNIADECKDPNELLMKDSQRLKNNIQKILENFN